MNTQQQKLYSLKIATVPGKFKRAVLMLNQYNEVIFATIKGAKSFIEYLSNNGIDTERYQDGSGVHVTI